MIFHFGTLDNLVWMCVPSAYFRFEILAILARTIVLLNVIFFLLLNFSLHLFRFTMIFYFKISLISIYISLSLNKEIFIIRNLIVCS